MSKVTLITKKTEVITLKTGPRGPQGIKGDKGDQGDVNLTQLNTKVDKLMATNLVTNGDFSNGTTGWGTFASTISVISNTLSVIANGTATNGRTGVLLGSVSTNDKIYVKTRIRVTNSVCSRFQTSIKIGIGGAGLSTTENQILTPIINQWYNVDSIFTMNANSLTATLEIFHLYADSATANGKVMEVQFVNSINLTALFGAGKEPTKEQMDWLLAQKFTNSWFNGTAELTSITDLLTLVNTKADKTQEAWITPTLLNGATTTVGLELQYMKDAMGFVHFRGRFTTISGVIAILPVGYRSSRIIDFATQRGVMMSLWTNGELRAFSNSALTDNSIAHVTFRAEV